MPYHLFARVFAAVGLILLVLGHVAPARAAEAQALEIVTRNGVHKFSVEVAATDQDRQRGLMFRRELPEGHGMLFDFKQDLNVSMWMKNTYVPLDMIFIRADGRIHRIAADTVPESTAVISAGAPVRAVLEIVAGTAQKLGIKAGDRVAHPLFRSR
jgi:uncharacterized membrane protein (UPF0127 family)